MNLKNKLLAFAVAALAAIKPTRSVSGIVADLERKLAQLDEVETAQLDKAAAAEARACELVRDAVNFRAEAQRARRVGDRLVVLTH